MAYSNIIRMLQLFAEGGDGGAGGNAGADAGASSVVAPADDGRARLQALGVPADKIRNGRNYAARQMKQDAAAKTTTPGAKVSFADLLNQNPDYKGEVEKIVQKRVAKLKNAGNDLELLKPALKRYAEDNGLAPDTDIETISKYMNGEYESKALELGVSERTAMEMDMRERKAVDTKRRERFAELQQQADQFRQIVPNFDLMHELETNPKFVKYTSPDVGMSVEEAFRALYGDRMQQALAMTAQRKAQEMVTNAIASGSRRPVETGINAQAPTNVPTRSYADMSMADRARLKRAIMGTTGGQHIKPGDRY